MDGHWKDHRKTGDEPEDHQGLGAMGTMERLLEFKPRWFGSYFDALAKKFLDKADVEIQKSRNPAWDSDYSDMTTEGNGFLLKFVAL